MPRDTFLISEAVLRSTDKELRARMQKVKGKYAVDAEDEVYGAAFRYFLLFDRWPDLLVGVVSELTALTCFYNKYYWFLQFKRLWALKHGYDAGIEQQAFQLLEAADHELEVDLSVIERIEMQINAEMGETS